MHLDDGYGSSKTRDLLTELGCEWIVSEHGKPLQAGARWIVENTNSWHNRGFKKLLIRTERNARVIDAKIDLANSRIILRRLRREARYTYRWDTRPQTKALNTVPPLAQCLITKKTQ